MKFITILLLTAIASIIITTGCISKETQVQVQGAKISVIGVTNEKIENDTKFSYEKGTENYIERGNQTPTRNRTINQTRIKIRGKIITGEEPITTNSRANWSFNVVFDSNITEKEAEEIISGYEIPIPRSMGKGISYPEYYISASISDFESIKNRLEENEYSKLQLSKKIKIIGDNFTTVVWGVNDNNLPVIISSGIQLRETMVVNLVYGPETPQTESKNLMELLDTDEKIIDTTVDFFY